MKGIKPKSVELAKHIVNVLKKQGPHEALNVFLMQNLKHNSKFLEDAVLFEITKQAGELGKKFVQEMGEISKAMEKPKTHLCFTSCSNKLSTIKDEKRVLNGYKYQRECIEAKIKKQLEENNYADPRDVGFSGKLGTKIYYQEVGLRTCEKCAELNGLKL